MECPVCIQMTTHCVGVECNKEDIKQLSWDQLQMHVRRRPAYRLLQYQHVILDRDQGLAQRSAVVVVDFRERLVADEGRVED